MNMFENYKLLPVSKLCKAPWNYKEEDEFLTERLVENLKLNGQIENIIVRELDTGFYEIVNGNHRYDAVVRIGWTDIICCDLGKISEPEAIRKAVATNETRFKTDNVKLIKLMAELQKTFTIPELAMDLPYTPERIQNFKDLLEFNWENQPSGGGSDSQNDGNDLFRTVSLRLPEAVADQLEHQINRFKAALHPEDEISDISPVQSIEAMCQHLSHIPDDELI